MKKLLIVVMILACVLGGAVVATSCDTEKQTPVYEGMTLASSYTEESSSSGELVTSLVKENHDFVNEDGKGQGKPVDEIVTITVNGSSEVEYFVRPGEVFTVQVHLSNPDNFEIQSFTLNGEKYASYMFKDGSDMELLLLDVTAPAEAGYFDLTIDAIKYIDGTDIKDVSMEGDKTLKAATSYTGAPEATVSDLKILQNGASMNVYIADEQGLTDANGIKIYLTDGERVVAEKELVKGENAVSFEDLLTDTTYGYGVAASYDMLDGNGVAAHWLAKGTFTTGKAFYVTSVSAGQDHVDFTYERGTDSGVITAIKLLDARDNVLETLQGDENTFGGLLSGVTYKIRLEFTYTVGGESKSGTSTVSFSTVAKVAPVVSIENVASTRTDISFDIKTTDEDGILSLGKVVLLEGGVEIREFLQGEEYSVSGLDAGTLYTIKAEYSYDLNDGNGVRQETVSLDYPTLAASIAVEDITLLNTNVVKKGEELNMRIYFSNSSEIEMTDIYVNGIKVQVVGGDKKTSAIVKFVPDETGLIDFTVDKVEYLFYDTKVNQNIDSDVSVTYPVYGDLENARFEAISASPYEYTGAGIYFSFDNKENYVVYKINDGIDFVTVASGEYYVDADEIVSVEYGYDDYGRTTQVVDHTAQKHSVSGYTTVSTPQEFLAMTDGYYVLTQDIDMRNVPLTAKINLTGIFDGAGHTVRGLTRVIDTSKAAYYDVFAGGAVYDLNFSELYASVDNSKSNSQTEVSALGNVKLYNCTLTGDVIASNAVYTDLDVAGESVTYTINKTVNGINSVDRVVAANKIDKDTAVAYDDGAIVYTLDNGNKVFVGYYGNTMTEFDASPYFAVEENAFAFCNSLTSFIIPEGVLANGLDLTGCNIEYAEYDVGQKIDYNKSWLKTLVLGGSGSIEGLEYYCSFLLTSVTFKDGCNIESIGSLAFAACVSLESIIIPEGVKSIGSSAFAMCSSLEKVIIPESVTEMGESVFMSDFITVYCMAASQPSNWSDDWDMGVSVVWDCNNNVVAEDGCLYFVAEDGIRYALKDGEATVASQGLLGSEVEIPSNVIYDGNTYSVTGIGESAFMWQTDMGSQRIDSITIPVSVKRIGMSAIGSASVVLTVYYEGSLTDWNNVVVESDNYLTVYCYSETLPDETGNYWHYVNGEITQWGWGDVKTYSFVSNGGTTIADVDACALKKLPAPEKQGYVFAGWFDNEELAGDPVEVPYYNAEKTTLYAKWMQLSQSSGLEILNGKIVGIGTCTDDILILDMPVAERAFKNCTGIKKVVFMDGVTSIAYGAFENCDNLTEAVFTTVKPPEIASDVFPFALGSNDFRIYVPAEGLNYYKCIDDLTWKWYVIFNMIIGR